MTFFNEALGFAYTRSGTVFLDTKDEQQVAPGLIHFAVIAALAEVAAAVPVGEGVPVNVQLSLLQAAKPGRLEGRGTLLRRGKRLAVAEGEVRQGETLVAKAVVTFSVR